MRLKTRIRSDAVTNRVRGRYDATLKGDRWTLQLLANVRQRFPSCRMLLLKQNLDGEKMKKRKQRRTAAAAHDDKKRFAGVLRQQMHS